MCRLSVTKNRLKRLSILESRTNTLLLQVECKTNMSCCKYHFPRNPNIAHFNIWWPQPLTKYLKKSLGFR